MLEAEAAETDGKVTLFCLGDDEALGLMAIVPISSKTLGILLVLISLLPLSLSFLLESCRGNEMQHLLSSYLKLLIDRK